MTVRVKVSKQPILIPVAQEIARRYTQAFANNPLINPLKLRRDVSHAFHLFITKIGSTEEDLDRSRIFSALRNQGIGVNVHYIPVHLHPFYRNTFGTALGDCPVSERAYEKIISLPIYPAMSDEDVDSVIHVLNEVINITK